MVVVPPSHSGITYFTAFFLSLLNHLHLSPPRRSEGPEFEAKRIEVAVPHQRPHAVPGRRIRAWSEQDVVRTSPQQLGWRLQAGRHRQPL